MPDSKYINKPCGECNNPNATFITLEQWCKDNKISTEQGIKLFKRDVLTGRRSGGSVYVALNCAFPELCFLREIITQLNNGR
jgi:hypothetical protein